MPANPMQKKARNAFLLGVLLTFLLVAIIGGLCYYFLVYEKNKEKEKEGNVPEYAFRLKRDIKTLEPVTNADVEIIQVSKKAIPSTAFTAKTQDGKDCTFPGLYYAKNELKAGTVLYPELFVTKDDDLLKRDENGELVLDDNGFPIYLNDVRNVEYNMLVLGTNVNVGSYVDVRITFPNGQDLIVISKKEVKALLGNTVTFELSEGEIELMQSAIVESYIIKSSKLYVTQYVDPYNQKTVPKSYIPTEEVLSLMNKNRDIVDKAFAKRDSEARDIVEGAKSEYSTSATQNIEAGIQEEIQNAQKAREAYLSGLTSY